MNFFSKLFRSRDKPKNSIGGLSFFFGHTTAGKVVNERTAMQATAVYACVRILAESIAGLPLHLYRYRSGGLEVETQHPLYRILHDEPNPEMTSFIFRETLMSHLLLWGNAYAQILRDRGGRVIGLYPLLPDRMDVSRDNVTGEIYYTYTPSSDDNPNIKGISSIRLRREDVLHIAGLGFDGLVGYSPIAMAKNAVGISLATEEYGASFFKNGATPSGILEHPGVLKDPEKLRESWQEQFSGQNTHKIAVLEEGMTFKPMSIPPEEAQFLETRKFQIDEIARIFRVPPHMVGDLEKSSFSNIEQQSLEFVKYTLNPWVVRWEQAMQKALLLPSEKQMYGIKFNVDGLLRGDYKSRMDGYAVGRQNGWLSANDIRSLENMNPIPDEEGGNLYLINGNMTKLKDAGLFAGKTDGAEQKGDTNET